MACIPLLLIPPNNRALYKTDIYASSGSCQASMVMDCRAWPHAGARCQYPKTIASLGPVAATGYWNSDLEGVACIVYGGQLEPYHDQRTWWQGWKLQGLQFLWNMDWKLSLQSCTPEAAFLWTWSFFSCQAVAPGSTWWQNSPRWQ